MAWFFRPGVLVAISLLMMAGAAWLAWQSTAISTTPQPLPVPDGAVEVAWLYPATSATSWDRLVEAVRRIGMRHGLDVIENQADTSSPLAAPEVALRWYGPRGPRQVLFRWYKLTSLWKASDWADAFVRRGTPPVAVISGSSTHWAREAALALRRLDLPDHRRPLLLLTTATADRVSLPEGETRPPPRNEEEEREDIEAGPEEGYPVRLHRLYPGLTYRFCFSNRQMATAVTLFVWNQPELRPDGDPAFLVQWTDDSYSMDLFTGYQRVLARRATEDMNRDGAMPLGLAAPFPASLGLVGLFNPGFRHVEAFHFRVDSSVGPYSSPNHFEANNVRWLVQRLDEGPSPRRPLLAVTGQARPTRRFLRHIAHSAPLTARRFVVVTGDAVSFDDVFRDRIVSWPIQELPFHLVFFCHRDPVSIEAGFDPEEGALNGTDSLLLYQDVVEAVLLGVRNDGQLATSPEALKQGLERIHLHEGQLVLGPSGMPLFRHGVHGDGMRQGGSGEHVVYVRPLFQGERTLPQAVIEVWRREGEARTVWKKVRQLQASYEEVDP